MYKSLVLPYFDYCSPLWDDCGSTLKEKLQKLQNRPVRIITGANYDVRSTDLLHTLSWKNMSDRHKMNKAIFTFKLLNNHSSPNLRDKFNIRNTNLGSWATISEMPILIFQFLKTPKSKLKVIKYLDWTERINEVG